MHDWAAPLVPSLATAGRCLCSTVCCALLAALCACSPASDVDGLRLAAEGGDAAAQLELGSMYDEGRGVSEDDAEAARWLRMAAEQGLAAAQGRLGEMYAEGLGVPRSGAEAARWLRLAADRLRRRQGSARGATRRRGWRTTSAAVLGRRTRGAGAGHSGMMRAGARPQDIGGARDGSRPKAGRGAAGSICMRAGRRPADDWRAG